MTVHPDPFKTAPITFFDPKVTVTGAAISRYIPAPLSPGMAIADEVGGGVKADAGKPTFDLLPVEALAEIQRVLEFGCEKYGAWNWAKGMRWSRVWNAAIRHLFAWVGGEEKDPESGISHLAHAGCCLLFLISYTLTGAGSDDRRRRAA